MPEQTTVNAKVQGSVTRRVFFRLDDVAVAKGPLRDVLSAFVSRQVPIHCSVIPGKLQEETSSYLLNLLDSSSGIEIGQHGWMHADYGGKGEFGSNRPFELQLADIRKGMEVMKGAFGQRWVPVFTPPFGRWSRETIRAISYLGFSVISSGLGTDSRRERWLGPLARKLGIRTLGTATPFSFLFFSYHPGPIPCFPGVLEMSVSVDTLVSYNPVQLRSPESVLTGIERSFSRTSVVGVLLHPQYFSDKEGTQILGRTLDLICSSGEFEVTSLWKIAEELMLPGYFRVEHH
jgi:peptidoglycan/xylan/chitin deacetylase (PgdA/CDA1 family)